MSAISNRPSGSFQMTNLPFELILGILEFAARTWIDVHPRWTASLQLISRATRSVLEPIIYRMFVVERAETHVTESQSVPAVDAQRLVQILENDTPKIHHLVLRSGVLDVARPPDAPTRSVPRLSIIKHHPDRLTTLPDHPTKPLKVTSNNAELIHCGHSGNRITFGWIGSWERIQFWEVEDWKTNPLPYYFLAIDAPATRENNSAGMTEVEPWCHIQLKKDTKHLMDFLPNIADLLLSPSPKLREVHIVIVCSIDYESICGLGVDETVQLLDASRTLPSEDRKLEEQWCVEQHLSVALEPRQLQMLRWFRVDPDVLYSRVHVSHALWGFDGPGWPGSWYGRAVERGDAWDEGRQLRRFV